ncbi:hypothetical protein GW891_05325 [bacterium]|nr:hypothetical protein [bacterium]
MELGNMRGIEDRKRITTTRRKILYSFIFFIKKQAVFRLAYLFTLIILLIVCQEVVFWIGTGNFVW